MKGNTYPLQLNSKSELDDFVGSSECYSAYKNQFGKKILYETQLFDKIIIEHECEQDHFAKILAHIKSEWTDMGANEPHWSVVSTSDFKADRISDTIKQFNESGRFEVENLKRLLSRNGLDISSLHTGLEYGCGVGRVTRWLATIFGRVIGVDVSSNHIQLATKYFSEENIGNINTIKVDQFSDVERLPFYDFLYSKIVLQHNPPPIIARTFDVLCEKLYPGGVGVVQIPTYAKGYEFLVDKYLKNIDEPKKMEMHILPQRVVFEILHRHQCVPIEVSRDHLIPTMDYVSTTFVFRKTF